MTDQPHPNLRHLPFGAPDLEPRADMTSWDIFPYAAPGGLRLRTLEPPLPAEAPRMGESGPDECRLCAQPDEDYLWTDELWRLKAAGEPSACPAVVLLEPRAHADITDLPAPAAAGLGPMIQRVDRAVSGIGGVGRVHFYRFGDGAAHLHLWFLARPLGVKQLHGSFLASWDDALPAIGRKQWLANLAAIAAAMAADGGAAHVAAAC